MSGARELAGLVRQCASSGAARRALLLRLDLLPARSAKPFRDRLVQAALDPLLTVEQGKLFTLQGGALAVVWRGGRAATLERAGLALHHLLSDTDISAADLLRVYDLPHEAEALLAALPGAGQRGVAGEEDAAGASGEAVFDPDALAALEGVLARANVETFARRRTVFTEGESGFEPAWEERYLSVRDLTETLSPEHLPRADPWLFRRLTRTLDRRMLVLLASPEELRGARPFALNLNVASIVSSEFLRFDGVLPAQLRGRVVIYLTPSDIFADTPGFLFARAFARSRGYRLLLREVEPALLPVLPFAALDLDLLELSWSPALEAVDAGPLPKGRIVLAGIDEAAALSWARANGVTHLQGAAIR